ncbi:MAG: chorismate mutase [Treponema sp.]|jgi:chorismate mutase|nr:chorismate mutase [Treponema sp.]
MTAGKRLFALRGATRCKNDPEDITEQVGRLYDELLALNNLAEPDIVSILFSATADLDALNPAAGLRRYGRAEDASLFALQEAAAQGGLERTVRTLIHCYLDEGAQVRHVYRNGAEVLRPDRCTTKTSS